MDEFCTELQALRDDYEGLVSDNCDEPQTTPERCPGQLGIRCGDEASYWIEGEGYCAAHITDEVGEMYGEAASELAARHVYITGGDMPDADQVREGRDRGLILTGDWFAYCRHTYSNYDELISRLDRNDLLDQVIYTAIRDRVYTLLEEYAAQHSIATEAYER